MITYRSLEQIKEKDGNHMEEIEEILCKDSRYNLTKQSVLKIILKLKNNKKLKSSLFFTEKDLLHASTTCLYILY